MINKLLTNAIDRLADGHDLKEAEAASVLEQIMSGRSSDVQTAAFLIALRTKGEQVGEIVGLARTMRRFSKKVNAAGMELVDTCGTGGDKSRSFNISTTAAFVVAGARGRVAKHGNRSATSQCGSADVLEALGANLDVPPAKVGRIVRQVGIGFMFAPLHHQATRHVVPVRQALGVRTIFNFLGPLTNPAGATHQLVGVSDLKYLEIIARSLKQLGCRHGLVVHGSDGLDEITVTGPTDMIEIGPRKFRRFSVRPEDFGLKAAVSGGPLRGGAPGKNANILKEVLSGKTGPRRDIVVLNAGAALFAAGRARSIATGVKLAEKSIDSGAAGQKLEEYVKATQD